jgi:hypothetical protein
VVDVPPASGNAQTVTWPRDDFLAVRNVWADREHVLFIHNHQDIRRGWRACDGDGDTLLLVQVGEVLSDEDTIGADDAYYANIKDAPPVRFGTESTVPTLKKNIKRQKINPTLM